MSPSKGDWFHSLCPLPRLASEAKHEPSKESFEEHFVSGCSIVNDGLVMMTQLQEELQCCLCSETVQWPLLHCRKGHICCSKCRRENSCRICKQTFVDTQNAALDRLLSFIQLPCKYRDAGCQESFALPHKHDHESVCQFRPVQCQYQCHGCDVVTSAKVS